MIYCIETICLQVEQVKWTDWLSFTLFVWITFSLLRVLMFCLQLFISHNFSILLQFNFFVYRYRSTRSTNTWNFWIDRRKKTIGWVKILPMLQRRLRLSCPLRLVHLLCLYLDYEQWIVMWYYQCNRVRCPLLVKSLEVTLHQMSSNFVTRYTTTWVMGWFLSAIQVHFACMQLSLYLVL